MSSFPQLQQALGATVRQARKRQQWSIREMEKISGLRKSHLSKIESGTANPCLRTIEKLARIFKTTPGDFMRDVEWLASLRDERPAKGGGK